MDDSLHMLFKNEALDLEMNKMVTPVGGRWRTLGVLSEVQIRLS